MNYLLPGNESAKRVELLLQLTRIDSEPVIAAVLDHLVRGMAESEAAIVNGTTKSNLNRAISRINDVTKIHEQLKVLDLPKLKKVVG